MGIINKVRKVENSKPELTATAIGDLNSAPSVWLNAMGSIPSMVVIAVTSIGRSRAAAPFTIASPNSIPLFFNRLVTFKS